MRQNTLWREMSSKQVRCVTQDVFKKRTRTNNIIMSIGNCTTRIVIYLVPFSMIDERDNRTLKIPLTHLTPFTVIYTDLHSTLIPNLINTYVTKKSLSSKTLRKTKTRKSQTLHQ